MIVTGVVGAPWRASVTPWGAIDPWDGGPRLDWYVAADDRWHVPATEPTTRQVRVDGTAVAETRVRVPNGDVVQRVYSVPDHGGVTVVEVENESTLPVAVAFDRSDVLVERQVPAVPVAGIELPADAFVLPLGHRATLRIGLAHRDRRAGVLRPVPPWRQVVNGWLATAERASRFVLPDGGDGAGLATEVIAQRCDVALGALPDPDAAPAELLVAIGEQVRMGEPPQPWLGDVVAAVARSGPVPGWTVDAGLAAAARVVAAAGEDRALRDLRRIRSARPPATRPTDRPAGVAVIPWLEQLCALGGDLLPGGFPVAWRGHPFEVHGVPTDAGSAVSFAIRWHGERPAVLWEQTDATIPLTASMVAPGWATTERRGEALWPPVALTARPPVS